jgi:hypothetical protein
LTVRLTDAANNWVYADAVRIQQVYLPTLYATFDGQPIASGDTVDMGRLLKGSAGEGTFTFTSAGLLPLVVDNLVVPADPQVDVTVNNFGNGVFQAGESFTIDVDLDTSPATGLAPGRYDWDISFESNDVDNLTFDTTFEARIVDRLIINDGDRGFQLGPGSDFGYLPSSSLYYNHDVHYHAAGVPGDVNTVQWIFEGLAPGTYDVSATWFGGRNRATDAPFSASDDTGLLASTTVNQEPHPGDFTTPDGTPWDTILPGITISPDAGQLTGTLIIELSDQANEYVIADAVMI